MTLLLFLLAMVALGLLYLLIMKTAELSAAVDELSAATDNLAVSVDAAIAVLMQTGAVTPDADLEPLITRIGEKTGALQTLKAKLAAALTTPKP
jgi:hypothetical protein